MNPTPTRGRIEARGTLPFAVAGGPRVLAEILRGGQTFLWEEISVGHWRGVIGELPYRLVLTPENHLEWTCTDPQANEPRQKIEVFFASVTDFQGITEALPWRSDSVLAEAIKAFPGLRVLHQPIGTTLLAFLLSPLKRIEQIRAGLLEISRRWGRPLGNGLHAPPPWEVLASASEADLRECGIGYRARSIYQTALRLAESPGDLDSMESLSTIDARNQLLTLPGVGRKIADCVLLFGCGRLEAFPIDTWISRHMRESYGLHDFSEDQVQRFAAAHFGIYAGVAQQFLFARARSLSRKD